MSADRQEDGGLAAYTLHDCLRLCHAQVDALSRQLARGAADGEELGAQRENLLAELASAQQVSLPALATKACAGEREDARVDAGAHPTILRPLLAQVRLLLERNREDLQRQLAVSEGQLGLRGGACRAQRGWQRGY